MQARRFFNVLGFGVALAFLSSFTHADTQTPTPQTPTVQATLGPSTAQLGDILTLQLNVVHHAAFTTQAPVFQKMMGTFEVRASTALLTDVSGSQLTDHFVAQLQNFTTGVQTLPGIDITYKDLDQKSHVIRTPELKVTINDVPPGPKDKGGDIRGIKGVIGPVAWSPWWWLLLALALVGAGAYAWHRRERKILGPPPPPPVPADQQALKRLDELKGSGLIEAGQLKEFYSALSDIVRAYVENGFSVPALERTTNELMRDLRKRATFDGVHQGELQQLLESGDLVKFAKFRPEATEALTDHSAAVKFVNDTRVALGAPK